MALAAGRKSREIVPLVGALKANQIPVADMPAALGKMLYAGETGGYGVQNMIESLPRLLAAQRDNYGIVGMKGLEMALVDMMVVGFEEIAGCRYYQGWWIQWVEAG
jgi:hypothetical protein